MELWTFIQAMFGKDYRIEPARYPFSKALLASEKQTVAITINRGSDFIPMFIRHSSTGAFSAGINVGNRDYQNSLVPSHLWGNPQASATPIETNRPEPFPLRCPGASDLKVTLQDDSAAPNTVVGVIEGVHISPRN